MKKPKNWSFVLMDRNHRGNRCYAKVTKAPDGRGYFRDGETCYTCQEDYGQYGIYYKVDFAAKLGGKACQKQGHIH